MSIHGASISSTGTAQAEVGLHRLVAVTTGRGNLFGFRLVTLMAFAILVLLFGIAGTANIRYGLIFSTVYAVAILGNNAIAATLGEINLSSGAFIAIGAYATTVILSRGFNVFATMLAALLLAGILGALFAIPVIRLSGLGTALVTFTLAFSIVDLANALVAITGGDAGIPVPLNAGALGLQFSGSRPGMLVLVVVVMVVLGVAHLWLMHGRPGRIAIAVGETEVASAAFGTNIVLVKLAVWTWSAAIGGVSGALYALSVGYVSSSQWPVMISLFVFVGGLIGGARSATGAWLGGIVVGGLPLWLQNFVPATATSVLFGAVIVVALLAGGKGLAEFGERASLHVWRRLRRQQ